MNKKIIAGSLFLLLGNVWATVTASVDRNQVAMGQSFTLTINMPDSGDNPELDVLKNSFEIFGTSSSSQTNIINGKVSSQNTFTVNLIAKNPGKQTIPPIKVGNDMTKPINIEVLPEATTKNDAIKDSSVYLDATVSKQNIYVNVPFLYTIKLYYAIPLANLNMEPLNIENAQVEAQGKSTQYQSTENGKTYQVIEQSFLITPNKAGKLTIPPARIKGAMADNDNSNSFFPMMANKPFVANSKPLNLQVRTIPDSIPLNEWLPAKNLKVTDNWSQNVSEVKVGDPLTHTITLEATGIPATSIPEIEIAKPDGVNTYPDKPQSTTNTVNGELVGNRTFKIAYIVTKPGTLTFPETQIKWWDINSDSLKIATIPARTYKVTADATIAPIATTTPPNTVEKSTTTTIATTRNNNSIWLYLTTLFASLWLITLFIAVKLYRRKPSSFGSKPSDMELDHKSEEAKQNSSISVEKACQMKDTQALNIALINWAKAVTNKKIYSITDIKLNINDAKLHEVLDKLNAAIYKGTTFDEFDNISRIISSISISNSSKTKKETLKNLYPQ